MSGNYNDEVCDQFMAEGLKRPHGGIEKYEERLKNRMKNKQRGSAVLTYVF